MDKKILKSALNKTKSIWRCGKLPNKNCLLIVCFYEGNQLCVETAYWNIDDLGRREATCETCISKRSIFPEDILVWKYNYAILN